MIDGKAEAAKITEAIGAEVAAASFVPGLAVVLVGDDPASAVYVRNKSRTAERCGFHSVQHTLPADTSMEALLALVAALNADPAIHGILVQLPLPRHLDPAAVIAAIDPDKDVDGLHVVNAGRLAVGDPAAIVPCTPLGSMHLIGTVRGTDLSGLNAVVVGRSRLVGLPLALLLTQANATVTIAHSRTKDLDAVCRGADILAAAVGRPQMLKGGAIKPGATVIDIGINRIPDATKASGSRLVGDVAFDEAGHAGAITPVPGGVGPMTIAMLMRNTLDAARRAAQKI
ncbi:bifunctional methylenetetrahydrofolate dehydrogenase/methenyltetrahydrofolate cyclohydrolase FolD [Acuticoccus kandeliae]|uniref:bifunctional methylenetetrahydrofolate dehydrogenase/methenyltetrahydrofolate cyclohydrolase FolD n=1 Tax=Acuticoccus kandeliae TaxID=2073160 RepID=UPI000D3E06BD